MRPAMQLTPCVTGDYTNANLLLLEPFYSGRHKKLVDTITSILPKRVLCLITMNPTRGTWHPQAVPQHFAMKIPHYHQFQMLLCPSVMPLEQLLEYRPDLRHLTKVVYFHDDRAQFTTEVLNNRYCRYGFNEVLSSLVADHVLFNSLSHMNSFLRKIPQYVEHHAEYPARQILPRILWKCKVVYYPINTSVIDAVPRSSTKVFRRELMIVWPHCWEYDKNPESFFTTLRKLDADNASFKVCLLGNTDVYRHMGDRLQQRVVHCGHIKNQREYIAMLRRSDVVVSTALNDTFGPTIMEAVYAGCIPIVPKRGAYKELYGCLVNEMYNTDDELYRLLFRLCRFKSQGIILQGYPRLAVRHSASEWFLRTMDLLQYHTVYCVFCYR